jgi:hypothetical protein
VKIWSINYSIKCQFLKSENFSEKLFLTLDYRIFFYATQQCNLLLSIFSLEFGVDLKIIQCDFLSGGFWIDCGKETGKSPAKTHEKVKFPSIFHPVTRQDNPEIYSPTQTLGKFINHKSRK